MHWLVWRLSFAQRLTKPQRARRALQRVLMITPPWPARFISRTATRVDHRGEIDINDARPIARIVSKQVFAADAGIVERDVKRSEVL